MVAEPVETSAELRPVADPADWRPEDLEESSRWIHPLDADEISEIDRAVAFAEASGKPIGELTQSELPLAKLEDRLADIRREIVDGGGIMLIRNLPVERYSRLQCALAYWAIGLRIGVPVSQNAEGHLLGHVKNLSGDDFETETHRGYHTSSALPWHADSCDVVGLLCLHTSKSGGESYVVSSVAIHNEMVRRRPDLAAELAKPWYRDRRGEVPPGMDPWWSLPVFNYVDGRLVTSWQGKYIRSAQRFEELPRFTAPQTEALDMMTALAEELSFAMRFEPGDIQLLHNHVILHRRSLYEDWPEPERKRHLLRLWLATPGGRALPAGLVARYGKLGPSGRPAGIHLAATVPTMPLDVD